MIQRFAYAGRSDVVATGASSTIRFAPNLAREPVSFDAELCHPLRFREAISALHDVVISDLRFQKRDRTQYEQWKAQETARMAALRRGARDEVLAAAAAVNAVPLPAGFQKEHDVARKRYWAVRSAYSQYLQKHDPALWRQLMPCDPVITVADDVVFFECFSKDESAYGHLSVGREAGFGPSHTFQRGTTNVDYSLALYEHFQTLRTYRKTCFTLDPESFSSSSGEAVAHREEKIDLPTSWLRGFMKLQAAMTMGATRVRLSRETVYSLLAFLKRHKAKATPRALRFELSPGQAVRLVLEPWEQAFDDRGAVYEGPSTAPIRIWGTRRLLILARLLPLADSIDVYLLATGLPSFWVVRMGEMTFTLGLSGWTANDWSAGSALDLLQPPRAPSLELIDRAAAALKEQRSATLSAIGRTLGVTDEFLVAAALRHLAQTGQVIFDLGAGVFRFRQIMPQPLGEAQLGAEDDEVTAARKLIGEGRYELIDRQDGPNFTRVIAGKVESKPVEILVDRDDRIKRGKCLCGHFKKYGLRNGPCRHMIALRWGVSAHGRAAFEQGDAVNRLLGRPSGS